jgi:predicted nucleic acid-binding protein
MNGSLIIDCSITMSWCFPDEAAPASLSVYDQLPGKTILVPAHWFLEVTNVLSIAERHKRIPEPKSAEFISLLEALEIEVDHEAPSRAYEHILPLCRKHGLTSYDAAYLELALRRRLPLASLDSPLRAAAKKLGVKILGK